MTTKIQKLLFFDVFIVSLIVLGCFLTAIFTNQMVTGKLTQSNVKAANYGMINFGLIWGTKQYNYGYGEREEETYYVYDEYREAHSIPLIITTLSCVAVASVFMVVSIIFALMNTMTVPIQTIHGSFGLYIWNGIAGGFGLLSLVIYTSIFETTMKMHIQSMDEDNFEPSDDEPAKVGYSFWLLFSGVILVVSNIGCLFLADKASDPNFFKRKTTTGFDEVKMDKNIADGIIF